MLNRKTYLIISIVGLVTMGLGQFMAQPQFYGSEYGRAWAHIFWFGFMLFLGSLLTWFTRYVAHNKNPRVVDAGKYQVMGIISVTGLVGLITITAIIMGNNALTEHDGDVRRGVFVIWLLLLSALTIINVGMLLFRQLKLAKRF